jgi:rubredoxin
MSAAFKCPSCGMPHKEITVPSEHWGVFVSNAAAEKIANDPAMFFDEFGWREGVDIPEAVQCSECGWIGRWPPAESR